MYLNRKDSKQKNKEAIVKTMAFFDIFDFAPTEMEIFEFLSQKISFIRLQESLSILLSDNVIREKFGFFYFLDREEIVTHRLRRYNHSFRKIKRALWVSKLFRIVPWVKMIAVANIIGSNNSKNNGDIDFLIITKNKRIWLSRFFCVIIIKFLGLRPRISDTKDKICLSFFLTETNLSLDKYMFDNNEDIYFQFWLAGLFPLYDADKIYQRLIKSNLWLLEKMPNFIGIKPARRWRLRTIYSPFYIEVADLLLGGLEINLKSYQQKILPPAIKAPTNSTDGGVVISDDILKFHVNDRRREFQKKYKQRVQEVIINI